MRQFLLGAKVAYPTASATADGSIGFYYIDPATGKNAIDSDGTKITKEGNIILNRAAANGGNIVIPFYKNHFSYSKMTYSAGTKLDASITIVDPTRIGEYSIIIARKGIKFNERNKWTASTHVKDVTIGKNALAAELTKRINYFANNIGIEATCTGNAISIKGTKVGEDFEILGADELMGLTVTYTTRGTSAQGDADYVIDLANKACAEKGIEYTYKPDYTYLYPNFPIDPLASTKAADTGFTIYTIRFAEPRQVRTRDEIVHQIVQLAFPTGTAAITTIDTILAKYAE